MFQKRQNNTLTRVYYVQNSRLLLEISSLGVAQFIFRQKKNISKTTCANESARKICTLTIVEFVILRVRVSACSTDEMKQAKQQSRHFTCLRFIMSIKSFTAWLNAKIKSFRFPFHHFSRYIWMSCCLQNVCYLRLCESVCSRL